MDDLNAQIFDPTSPDESALDELLLREGQGLRDRFDGKRKTLEATLSTIFMVKNHAENKQWPIIVNIYNAAGFVNVLSFDLTVAVIGIIFNNDQWTRRFFSRQAALLMHEACEDLFQVFGKEFRQTLKALDGHEMLDQHMREQLKHLAAFKGAHKSLFKKIRTFTTAHRDHNITEQLRVIRSINSLEMLQYAIEFDRILNALGEGMQKIMNACSAHPETVTRAHG